MIEKSVVLEAAKEMNELKISPKKIKTVATSVETLKEDFMGAIEAIPEKDEKKIPKKIAKLYNSLVEETEETDESEETEEDESEEEDEVVEADEEDEEDDEEEEDVKPKKKSAKSKKEEEEEETEEEEEEEETEDEEEEEEKPKKKGKNNGKKVSSKKEPKAKKEPKKRGFTRMDAILTIIGKVKDSKKPVSHKEVSDRADALFVQKGGNSNPSVSKTYTYIIYKVLADLEKYNLV